MSSIRITLPLALVWYRNRPPAQPQPDRASAPTLAASAVPEEGFDTFAMDGLQSANEARQMPGVLALAGRFLSGLMPTVVVSHGGAVVTSNTGPDNTAEPQEGVGLQGGQIQGL